ncbi:7536_t:CDS:2 [Gigaspora margarita]|uniref:7536_t:CDS:1 n=1 Tax=Gigaspora margarita TaxID=4874 RepID=A0ABN7UTJ9_GIGMA|nr:7536_t:CDS:2 [Gigaspora margarita]
MHSYIGLSESPTTYEITNGSTEFSLTEGEPENMFSNPFTFESADKDGKRTVLNFQSRLIYDYARLENSAFTSGKSDFDKKLKIRLKVKYVYFYDERSITKAWKDEAKEWDSIPIYWNAESKISTDNDCKYFIEQEDIGFIWILEKKNEGVTTK